MSLARADWVLGGIRWLGFGSAPARLETDVVVVSAHLDDAVFSLGAAISSATRHGIHVAVLTVLAGDPDSIEPAGKWDADTGFRTAGEAAQKRRDEDRRACEILGAEPIWLPFSDQQYERGIDDAAARATLARIAGERLVIGPGHPLSHKDHVWLARTLCKAFQPERLGFYLEQPYTALWADGAHRDNSRSGFVKHGPWHRVDAGLSDRLKKIRACRAYKSQLPLLDPHALRRLCSYEIRHGGEFIAWAVEPSPRGLES